MVLVVVVVVVVDMIGASVVMDWAVSFISSTDAVVALDSPDPSSVLTWTLFAASGLTIEVSRSECRAPDSESVFSSEVLTLPQSEISCNSDYGMYVEYK